MSRSLNKNQLAFVEEYLVDLNATQAAIRAGYAKASARQQGARLMTHAVIRDLIAEKMAERSERVEITADKVLKRLWAIGNAHNELQADSTQVRSLELVGKHLQMFTDGLAITNPDGSLHPPQEPPDLSALTDEEIESLRAIQEKLGKVKEDS